MPQGAPEVEHSLTGKPRPKPRWSAAQKVEKAQKLRMAAKDKPAARRDAPAAPAAAKGRPAKPAGKAPTARRARGGDATPHRPKRRK